MGDVLEKAKPLAARLMGYARDNILVNLRFLDVAVSALVLEQRTGMAGAASDGVKLYYDPVFLLKKYKEEPAYVLRMYLHILFHFIFFHSFQYDKLDREAWDLAADIAVEAAVMELDLPGSYLDTDEEKEKSCGLSGKSWACVRGQAEIYRRLHPRQEARFPQKRYTDI